MKFTTSPEASVYSWDMTGETELRTPQGNRCMAKIQFSDAGTGVVITCGACAINKTSAKSNDYPLVQQCITDMDNLLTNLQEYHPQQESPE